MWYLPFDLNREFARFNHLAEGMLGDNCCQPARAGRQADQDGESQPRPLTPKVCAAFNEAGDGLELTAEMPGVTKEGLEIEATSDSLTIKGEGSDRNYEATVPLRYKVKPDSAKASLEAGLLKLELALQTPLREKATKIEVV